MSNQNPYQVLGIPNSSDIQDVERAYLTKKSSFDNLKKLNSKQAKMLDDLFTAYSKLSDPYQKEEIDQELGYKKIFNEPTRINDESSLHDDHIADIKYVEPEYNKDKIIEIESKKDKTSNLKLFLISIAVLFGATFVYNKLFTNDTPPPPAQQVAEAKAEPEIIKSPLIIDDVNLITGITRYPSSIAFQDPQMFYAPNGELFPQSANIISSLPYTDHGSNTIKIQNPLNTNIFGRLVVQYSPTTAPKVLRHFYIPAKETLMLFNIPTGKQQVHILTLTDPTAHVSPIYNIQLGSSEEINLIANWNYPYEASELF